MSEFSWVVTMKRVVTPIGKSVYLLAIGALVGVQEFVAQTELAGGAVGADATEVAWNRFVCVDGTVRGSDALGTLVIREITLVTGAVYEFIVVGVQPRADHVCHAEEHRKHGEYNSAGPHGC